MLVYYMTSENPSTMKWKVPIFRSVLTYVENIKNELKLRDMIQKLPKFCMDFFIGIVCTICEKDSYFLELNIIFLIVVITMLIGKCRNHLKNVCKSYVPGKGLW